MSVSAQEVKELRDRTGAPIMDCKRALLEAAGDQERALRALKEKGLAKARKKSGRETAEGIIVSYVHPDHRLGVLMELACETDFVARNGEFHELGKELCMQVAAMSPTVVSHEELDESTLEEQKDIFRQQFKDKPDNVVERIVEGKMKSYYSEVCLLNQSYIRDDDKTVQDVINEAIGKLGENIEVKRFVRMAMGSGDEQ